MPPDEAVVRTPSTIGNFGPGFDATSLAIAWGGDRLVARRADEDRITLEGAGAADIPTTWSANCAAAAFGVLRDRHAPDLRVHLHIAKGAPPGSGLGSSASSSAAGALAFAKLHPDRDWDARTLVEAATFGESRVAGAHGDDVAAAVQGGLSLVRAGEVGRVAPPPHLHLAIVRPHLVLETRRMRAAVPQQVATTDAVANMANVAFLVDAFHRGDVQAVGRSLSDRVAAPGRRRHLPYYDRVEAAVHEQDAGPVAIAGSGPSLFALAETLSDARTLADTMAEAVRVTGIEAEAIACAPERRLVWQEELGL